MKPFITACFTLLLFCSSGQALSATRLKVFTEQFPPYNYLQEDQLVGINVELLNEVCRRAKIQCELELLPWKRAFENAKKMEGTGLISTSRTFEREELFEWVGPFVSSRSCLYKLKQRDDISINSVEDLTNYTIGISREDVYQKVLEGLGFEEGLHYLTYAGKYEDINMFKHGKLDLIIGSAVTIVHQLRTQDLEFNDVQPVFELIDPALRGNFLALNLNTPSHIISALQNALDEIKVDGYAQSIIEQYSYKYQHIEEPVNSQLTVCRDDNFRY